MRQKSVSLPPKAGELAAVQKLKASWFATQTGKQSKTMVHVNNELLLFKRKNQERPLKQLLRYHSQMFLW